MTRPAFLFTVLFVASTSQAQQASDSAPPVHPQPALAKSHPKPAVFATVYSSVFAGSIASVADATRGGGLAGVSLGGLVAHRSMRAFTFPGFDMELAAIRPVQPVSTLDGIFSFNLQPAWVNKAGTLAPYITGGYSRVFVSGNALNFGTGINLLPKSLTQRGNFLRIEARDYYTFASQRQHLVTLRIAFCFALDDD